MNIKRVFDKYDDEFLKFERIPETIRRSNRPDLHAFLLLNQLHPSTTDIISSAEHDEIWLEIKPEKLEKSITEPQIIELIRCGVRYDSEYDSLCMFV